MDLTVLQNGTFYPKYKSLRSDAVRAVRKAKILESINTSEALDIYQQAYNKYSELELLMDTTAPDVHWARVHFTRVCHKSMAHPFRFFSFFQIRN